MGIDNKVFFNTFFVFSYLWTGFLKILVVFIISNLFILKICFITLCQTWTLKEDVCKDVNARFTTVPLLCLIKYGIRYPCFCFFKPVIFIWGFTAKMEKFSQLLKTCRVQENTIFFYQIIVSMGESCKSCNVIFAEKETCRYKFCKVQRKQTFSEYSFEMLEELELSNILLPL